MFTSRRSRFGFLFATCVVLLVASAARASQTLVTDFDQSLGGWVFTNGPEFPGAQGSLTQTAGHKGSAARMAYDLSKGGNYVGATLATPGLNADGLSLWMRTAQTTKARLRVNDASGQTLQYEVLRTLEGSLDPSSWYPVLVDLGAPATYYGGANDGKPHLPLSSIGVLAVPALGATGFLEFDEVSAVLGSLEMTVTPDSLPLIAAPSGAGELSPHLAINVHTTGNSRALDLARDAGFTVVRLDLLWVHSELTPGVYNFQEFDGFVDSLAARGMRLHLILDYTNPLYPDVTDPNFSTVTIPAFAALARATAQHFAGKNLSYEIWNEPNSATFWPPQAGASLFADLCDAAIKAVHAGDPNALVTTGGTSGIDVDFIKALIANGGVASADAIGVHPYRKGGGESIGHDLVLLQNIVSSAMSLAPAIWDTEWGYSSAWEGDGHGARERTRQALLVTRELLSAWAIGFPLIVYYDLNDGGSDATNSDDNFGLITTDNADKPAMLGVRALSSTAKTRRYTGLLQTSSGSAHALRLEGADDATIVLWTDDSSRDTLVHLPGNAAVADYLGTPLQVQANTTSADITLKEADGPVYVTLANGSSAGGGTRATGGASGAGGSAVQVGTTTAAGNPGIASGGATRGGAGNVTGGARVATGGATRGGAGNTTATGGTARGGASNTTGGATHGGSANGGSSAGSNDAGHTTTLGGGAPQQPTAVENIGDTTTASGCVCSARPARTATFAWVWAISGLSFMVLRRKHRSTRRGQVGPGFDGD